VSGEDLVFLQPAASGGDEVALKERAASALERALDFVREHGDDLSRLQAFVALRAEPGSRLAEAVARRQADDGSFAPLALCSSGWLGRELRQCGLPDAVRGTVEVLALLSDARQEEAPCAERAVRFLESGQRPDGSFAAEDVEASSRVVATGVVAGSLARCRFARPEILAAAGEWLGAAFSPERVEAGHAAERVAFAMFYANAPDERSDEVLQWCGRELERSYRTQAAEALAVVQVLVACQVGSLPGASFAPEELLERLLQEQATDGGFDALAAEGRAARVGPTVDAMRAIIGLCATF